MIVEENVKLQQKKTMNRDGMILQWWLFSLLILLESDSHLLCYDSITLGLIKEENLVLGLIQKNLIKNSVQDCLPYILKAQGPCSTTLAYSK